MTTSPDGVKALAESWASSIDGKLDKFELCERDAGAENSMGHFDGYMSDASSMVERLLKRGFYIAPFPATVGEEAMALRRYRAVTHWIGADSWDGCPDCIARLRWAAEADVGREMTSDEIATALAPFHTLPPAPVQGDGDLREAIPPVERIETVPVGHPFSDEATDPYWRVIVSGYCADFETETAANFFRDAILALIPAPSPGLERLKAAARAMAKTDFLDGSVFIRARDELNLAARDFATEEADQARTEQEPEDLSRVEEIVQRNREET